MSNLTEVIVVPDGDSKPQTKAPPKRREPSFETLPNFSRVTPAQMSHITFPANGRYQPVRSVSSAPTKSLSGKGNRAGSTSRGLSNGYAGGGGILLLVDRQPQQAVDLIEWEDEPPAMEVEAPTATTTAMVDDGPEAPPPEPFEYPFDSDT